LNLKLQVATEAFENVFSFVANITSDMKELPTRYYLEDAVNITILTVDSNDNGLLQFPNIDCLTSAERETDAISKQIKEPGMYLYDTKFQEVVYDFSDPLKYLKRWRYSPPRDHIKLNMTLMFNEVTKNLYTASGLSHVTRLLWALGKVRFFLKCKHVTTLGVSVICNHYLNKFGFPAVSFKFIKEAIHLAKPASDAFLLSEQVTETLYEICFSEDSIDLEYNETLRLSDVLIGINKDVTMYNNSRILVEVDVVTTFKLDEVIMSHGTLIFFVVNEYITESIVRDAFRIPETISVIVETRK